MSARRRIDKTLRYSGIPRSRTTDRLYQRRKLIVSVHAHRNALSSNCVALQLHPAPSLALARPSKLRTNPNDTTGRPHLAAIGCVWSQYTVPSSCSNRYLHVTSFGQQGAPLRLRYSDSSRRASRAGGHQCCPQSRPSKPPPPTACAASRTAMTQFNVHEPAFKTETHIFTGVLGITESGFSGTRVLKLIDLVLRTTESGFSEPRVLKTTDLVLRTTESSFSESDCGNTVLDRTTTTSCAQRWCQERDDSGAGLVKGTPQTVDLMSTLRRAGNGT